MEAKNAPNFNWAERFRAALSNGRNNIQKPLPDVKISSVSSSGQLKLKFSQPMIIAPVGLIRSAIFESR